MLVLSHALSSELPSAPVILSKLDLRCLHTASPSTVPYKETTRPSGLVSLKSLAHWTLRAVPHHQHDDRLDKTFSYNHRLEQAHQKQTSLTQSATPGVPSPIAIFCLFSTFSPKNTASDSLLTVYTVDKWGTLSLVGSASIPALKNSPRTITLEFGGPTLSYQPKSGNLRIILAHLPLSVLEKFERKQHSFTPFICYGADSLRSKTLFGFLRFSGPGRLGPSRRVLLDQDGYQITHIGKGAFAMISRVLHRPSGDIRVMKRITFDKNGLAEYLARNEVETLVAMFGSPWFPPLLNHFKDETEFLVTMPFYQRGDLSGLLQHKGYLGRELAQFYSAQLIIAVHSLHKKGIIHRDIKTDNIFLDDQGHLILADLGLAENIATYEGGEEMMVHFPEWLAARAKGGDDFPLLWVNHENPLGTCGVAGTFWYTAPEVFRKEHYSFGVDYWSVGVIYHELITGHIPFNHYKPYPDNKRPALDFRIKPGQLKDVEPWEIQALSELLQPRPEDRPKTLTDIKRNTIFKGVDWTKMALRAVAPPLLPSVLREG